MVEQKLFTKEGELKTSKKKQIDPKEKEIPVEITNETANQAGKVIQMNCKTS